MNLTIESAPVCVRAALTSVDNMRCTIPTYIVRRPVPITCVWYKTGEPSKALA